MPFQAEFTRIFFNRATFQETSRLKKYHSKCYSEDSWREIIHQNLEIKIALSFNVKDLRIEIIIYKHFKHVIQ